MGPYYVLQMSVSILNSSFGMSNNANLLCASLYQVLYHVYSGLVHSVYGKSFTKYKKKDLSQIKTRALSATYVQYILYDYKLQYE